MTCKHIVTNEVATAYLAILLETFRLFALAAHVVNALRRSPWWSQHNDTVMINLGLECIRVLLATVLHCLDARIFIVLRVTTIIAIASIAIKLRSKTNTIELETVRLFAIAVLGIRILLPRTRTLTTGGPRRMVTHLGPSHHVLLRRR
jgi:hypothetical protein